MKDLHSSWSHVIVLVLLWPLPPTSTLWSALAMPSTRSHTEHSFEKLSWPFSTWVTSWADIHICLQMSNVLVEKGYYNYCGNTSGRRSALEWEWWMAQKKDFCLILQGAWCLFQCAPLLFWGQPSPLGVRWGRDTGTWWISKDVDPVGEKKIVKFIPIQVVQRFLWREWCDYIALKKAWYVFKKIEWLEELLWKTQN